MSNLVARSQDEIAERVGASKSFFGFEQEVLIGALDYEHAKPYLKEEATKESWDEVIEGPTQFDQMRKYMEFAIGKCQDHRGISASRSVEKLNAWTWLLGCEPIDDPYAQYGAPILKALCERHGFDWPDDEELNRMAVGKPCHDECMEGCES